MVRAVCLTPAPTSASLLLLWLNLKLLVIISSTIRLVRRPPPARRRPLARRHPPSRRRPPKPLASSTSSRSPSSSPSPSSTSSAPICSETGYPLSSAVSYAEDQGIDQAQCIANCKTDSKCLSTGLTYTYRGSGSVFFSCFYYDQPVSAVSVVEDNDFTFNDKAC